MIRFAVITACATAALFVLSFGQSRAQTAANWPTRPIKLIAPIEAGGGTDLSMRVVAQKLSQLLGPTIVENKPGAAGLLGMQDALNAPADGYTFVGVNDDRAFALPYLFRTPPYDPVKDFTYVGHVLVTGAMIMVVNAKSDVHSFQEFVQRAKVKPEIPYSTYGVGSTPHLGFEALKKRLNLELLHVPYKGSAPALTSVVQNETFVTAGSQALQFVEQGTLRAIAVGGTKRFDRLPNVPSLSELGGGGDIFQAPFLALAARAGTPQPIVDRLSAELKKVLAMPDVIESFKKLNVIPYWSSPAEFTEIVRNGAMASLPVINELGLANQ